MLSVRLPASPLAAGERVTIAYRSFGAGLPLVFLHGGWGYEAYPFSAQAEVLAEQFHVLVPDRAGHGRSTRVASLPPDFHRRGMLETAAFLDALDVERAVWWGHSDGAVIAATAAIEIPDRVDAAVLEALHLYRDKPGSRAFFEQMAENPDGFGARLKATLELDHGADHWRRVLELDGRAWLDLAAAAQGTADDLYGGRLPSVSVPVLLVQGGRDPRIEPGEFDAVRAAIPHAVVDLHPDAGHSPHSEPASAAIVTAAARSFLLGLAGTGAAPVPAG